ncbi:hypothetical protein RHMOL_Rhmol10G0071500 [Rhododendron molle]|uniref:Uncharacterized protein n=1 Tax=Rhododendron molle TaxID=49168 RepID=A0ACC0LZI9_RHOML|nr:hypothetical protein RHMOL_Rhmol10G0071500 [Rhododendron molle]
MKCKFWKMQIKGVVGLPKISPQITGVVTRFSTVLLILYSRIFWIFDVVVLMHNLEPVRNYEWSTTAHELQESSLMPYVVEEFGTPRELRTSCFPSAMSIKDNMLQFGYDCRSGKSIIRVFGKHLRDLFHYAGVDKIFVHMRNKWWSIPRINNLVDCLSLDLLLNDLNLQPLDFVLVTAFDDTDVNVIVFGGDGIEKLYPWT